MNNDIMKDNSQWPQFDIARNYGDKHRRPEQEFRYEVKRRSGLIDGYSPRWVKDANGDITGIEISHADPNDSKAETSTFLSKAQIKNLFNGLAVIEMDPNDSEYVRLYYREDFQAKEEAPVCE